jgi:hypothetical protein
MDQPTYDDVNLILKLYEIRREPRLRDARSWLAKLQAGTLAELQAQNPRGSEGDASFRMATTYWDMVASFITSGVLNQELFLESGNELLFTWTKIGHLIPALRAAFQNPKYLSHLETVANAAIKRMNHDNPGAYEAFSARVRGIPVT